MWISRIIFEKSILAEKQRLAFCNTTKSVMTPTSVSPEPGCPPETSFLTPQLVIVSALIDSINPCTFAVLIFLLISMSAAGNRCRILLVGTTYVLVLFLFHLLANVGVLSLVMLSGYSRVFSLFGATFAVLSGVITIIDVLKNRENYLLGIPVSKKANTWRLANRRILRLVVGLAMIALGIIIFLGWIG